MKLAAIIFQAFLCTAFIALPVNAQKDQPEGDDIARSVAKLAGDTFSERQEAMRELIRAGANAIQPLRDAILIGDPETQMRAVSVLGRLAIDRDPDCQRSAQDVLSELALSENRDIKSLSKRTLSKLGEAMTSRALQDLQQMGATIDVTKYQDGVKTISSYIITVDPGFTGKPTDYGMLTWLEGPKNVTLIGEQITNEVIEQLKGIRDLATLIIKRGTIDNAALKSIVKIESLRILHFYYVNIDDDGMDTLAEMKALSALRLIGTRVTAAKSKWSKTIMNSTAVDWRNGAFLGIYFSDDTGPCIVSRIVEGSSADRSKIKPGDNVIEFAGKKIKSGQQFLREVATFFPGDKVKATVVRGEALVELELELGRFPDHEEFKDQ